MLHRRLNILAFLFTLTGAAALLAEQAFEKMLSVLLGATTPAAATVLAVYFGGLALGGALFDSLSRRWRGRALRLYGLLELCVCLWTLLLYLAFDKLTLVFAPFLTLGVDRFWLLQTLRVLVAACWILPATVPMGATFPAISEALLQLGAPEQGRAMARFYSLNLLGALTGAVAGPFLFFPHLGVDGVLLFTFAVEGTVAAVAVTLALRANSNQPVTSGETVNPQEDNFSTCVPGLITLAAFVSGFVFFALEVLWTHLIAAVLGNSVYAFAAMLAVVLLGLGLGGMYAAGKSDDNGHLSTAELGVVLACGALTLTLTGGLWPDVPGVLARLGRNVTSFAGGETLRWLMAVMMVLPSAAVLGMVYPILFRLKEFPVQRAGRAAGRLVVANSVGCVVGAMMCGFVLIPWLGSERTLTALTICCAVLAVGVSTAFPVPQGRKRAAWVAVAAFVLAVFQPHWNRLHLTSGLHVYFRMAEVNDDSTLEFFHEDTLGGITTVVENSGYAVGRQGAYRTLLTNGKFQGNDSWELDAQKGFALVPMLFVPHYDDALVIGLGTGHSAHVVDEMGFQRIDVAEIAPGIVLAAREWFGHINGAVLDKPHVKMFLEDGRNVLLLRNKQYDLITMEISSVWFAGSTSLYSEEFYRLARKRLKPAGVFQQWIQIHHIGTGELLSVIATVRHVFPHVSFWVVGGQGILVGTVQPQVVQSEFNRRVVSIGWTKESLLGCRVLTSDDVTAILRSRAITLNTDRNRQLEYFTPRYNYSVIDHRARNLAALRSAAQVGSSIDSIGETHNTRAGAAATRAVPGRVLSQAVDAP